MQNIDSGLVNDFSLTLLISRASASSNKTVLHGVSNTTIDSTATNGLPGLTSPSRSLHEKHSINLVISLNRFMCRRIR